MYNTNLLGLLTHPFDEVEQVLLVGMGRIAPDFVNLGADVVALAIQLHIPLTRPVLEDIPSRRASSLVTNKQNIVLGLAQHGFEIVHHAPTSTHTTGRDILKYGPRKGYVELDGERYDIRAQVHKIGGYSAHADQKDLLNFVKRMRKKPREIRIVHGDEDAKRVLQQKFRELVPEAQVLIPHGS